MRREVPGQARCWAGQGTPHTMGMVLGKSQGVTAAPHPGMKAPTEASHTSSQLSRQSDPGLKLPSVRAHLEDEVAGPVGGTRATLV